MVDPRVRPLEGIKVYPTVIFPLKKEKENKPGLQPQIQLAGLNKIEPPQFGYKTIRFTRAAQYVLNLIEQDAIKTGNGTPRLENLAHRLLEITRGSDTKVAEITSKLNFEGVKQLLGVQDKRQQETGIKNKFYNFDKAFNKTNLLIQEELIEKTPELTGETKDLVLLASRYRNDSVVGIGGLLQALCETCEADGNKDKKASAVLSALGITKDRVSAELKKLDDIDIPYFQFLANNKNTNPKGFVYPASWPLYGNEYSNFNTQNLPKNL